MNTAKRLWVNGIVWSALALLVAYQEGAILSGVILAAIAVTFHWLVYTMHRMEVKLNALLEKEGIWVLERELRE